MDRNMECQPVGEYYVRGRQGAIKELKTLRNRSLDALAYPFATNALVQATKTFQSRTKMKLFKVSAFSDGDIGGNPAGVAICDAFPEDARMQRTAAEVGFSETAFAVASAGAWRVRYFSPAREVSFCGHATIALGAVLALIHGDGVFKLVLNDGEITVEGRRTGALFSVALQSPPTHSRPAPQHLVQEVLDLFGYTQADVDTRIPPAVAHGGANHLVVALNTREALRRMKYVMEIGRELMVREGLVTILFGYAETGQLFHTRNPFAYGGVYEDPATGAATAALAGYLRDIGWPHQGVINIIQGVDMGVSSRLKAEIPAGRGRSIRLSGTARIAERSVQCIDRMSLAHT